VKTFQSNLDANTSIQEHTAASAPLKFIDLSRTPAHGQKSLRFIAGTALIAGSFLVYLAYPVILLYLPFSGSVKVGATVAVWVLSWAVFSAGIFLTGPQGYEWVKGLWTRMTAATAGEERDRKNSRSNSANALRAREPSTSRLLKNSVTGCSKRSQRRGAKAR